MVSALTTRLSSLGSSPDQGHCVMFLGNTLAVLISTEVYNWVLEHLVLGVTLQWTSISSTREYKYSNSFHATETGDMCWPGGLLGSHADFTYRLAHVF